MNFESENVVLENQENLPPRTYKGEKVSRYLIMFLSFLLPIWVIPLVGFGVSTSKSFLVSVLVLAAVVFYLIYSLQEGRIRYPKSWFFLALLGVVFVTLVSSFFSLNANFSFLGTGSEPTSFFFILMLSVLLYLTAMLFQSEAAVLKLFFLLFISAAFVFVVEVLHLLFNWDAFGLLADKFSNLAGFWSELAIFFGFVALLAIVFLEFLGKSFSSLPRGNGWRLFFVLMLAASFVAMFFVNFTACWVTLAFFLLTLFVYLFSSGESTRSFVRLPLLMLLVCLFFILARSLTGDFLNALNLSSLEIRPSWSATAEIAKNVLTDNVQHFLLGSGPNTFIYDWLKFKPFSINQTVFWATRFQYGIGILPSLLATVGFLGGLAWAVFLLMLIYYGLRAISFSGDELSRSLLFGSFLGAVYLWVFNIIYVTSVFLFTLSFLMTGVFFALLIKFGKIRIGEYSFFKRTSVGFVSSLVVVLLLILSVTGFYMVFQKYWAIYLYGKGTAVFNQEGNLDKAESYFSRSSQYDRQDMYYRALSEMSLVRISLLVNQKQQITQDEISAQFQNFLASAVQNAQTAVDINPAEPLNWKSLGRVYQSVVPFGVQGAREAALGAYRQALEKAPSDPEPAFFSAQVEIQAGNSDKAQEFLASALQIKSNYTSALFLSAQLAAQKGDLADAISQTEAARLTAPNDIGVLFQLGLLYYQNKNYQNTVLALSRAVGINPNYSNARYFLGLAYDNLGNKKSALEQFEKIAELNPGNQEIQTILSNLRNEKAALWSISPPEAAPEKRKNPPIEEEEE